MIAINYPNYPYPYKVIDGCLYLEIKGRQNSHNRKLCNFTPYLVEEITVDDGLEVVKHLRIGGSLADGRVLPIVEIKGSELPSFNWLLDNWGVEAVLEVGKNVKDCVRHAILLTGVDADKKNIFTVTGWKQIDGKWHYLLPSDLQNEVVLKGKLTRYFKENSFSEEDIKCLFKMEEYFPVKKEIYYPLLALVFLSPLNEFLKRAGSEPVFVTALVGRTGTRKSTLAALFLSFFGNFRPHDLPLSFRDTANSIVRNSFALKDVLTCIDDFHPCSRMDESKMTSTAQSVIRSYGDRTGRARLRADSSLLESRPPQGNALLTAEYSPDLGESGAARLLLLELKDGDIDLDALSACQYAAENGALRRVMFAYTEWLSTTYLTTEEDEKDFVEILKSTFVATRNIFSKDHPECHGRIAETVACLKIGFEYYLDFMSDNGLINPLSMDKRCKEFFEIITEHAVSQIESIKGNKPTTVFIQKLYSLIESGEVDIIDLNNNEQNAISKNAPLIGYADDEYYYLLADPSIKAVKRLCREEGINFTISLSGLLKSLSEEDLIEKFGSKHTKPKKIFGENKRVMFLRRREADQIAGLSE